MHDRERGRRQSISRTLRACGVVVIVAVACTSCVGVIDRQEFDALVDSRGGGLTSDLVVDALSTVAAHVGTDDLELTTITVNPGSRSVVMTVRHPLRRDDLDRYVVSARDGIRDVQPVQVRANDDLDADSFLVSEVPALADIEELGDVALEALGFEEGHVETLVATVVLGAPRLIVTVESPRARGTATFDAAGALQEARRS